MRIVSIFCEIDNFFLAFGKYQAQRQLTENQNHHETRGCRRNRRGLKPRRSSQATLRRTSTD